MNNSVKTVETLVKISENAVEEKQKEIAAILNRLEQLEGRRKYLLDGIESEHKLAARSDDPLLYEMAGKFQERAQDEVELLDQAIVLTETELAGKRDELLGLYQEQKSNDIILERKKAAIKKEQQKKADAELDEMAGTRHNRKKEN